LGFNTGKEGKRRAKTGKEGNRREAREKNSL
jgi:hypothetical protein